MKMKFCLFNLIICALLFSACEKHATENRSVNENKSVNNQNVSATTENVPVNENQAFQKNIDTSSEDKTDFEGTAGIVDKKYDISGAAILKEVRTARHENFDRVTFEFEGAELPGYHIEYVDKPVRACGSGNVVNLKGDGWLEIRFQPAQAHDENGKPTLKTLEQSPNLPIIKELKSTCDFEADATWVLGVSSPNKYRVLELKNPTRLAIDVKH